MKKELLLAAMGLATVTPGCVKTGVQGEVATDPQPTGVTASTKVDIDNLLKRVAEKPAPKNLNPGAMCYSMMAPPDRAEYVCPSCGTKTIHALNQLERSWDAPALSVKHYRGYIEQLNKLGLVSKLDETYLCSACKKEGVSGLFLEVTVKGRIVRTALKSDHDLKKLVAFVQGDLVWKGDQGSELPLKPELPRIRQLLGVKE
jgi:DNA-directed RNA polymerase subunit RPC12/RpoP